MIAFATATMATVLAIGEMSYSTQPATGYEAIPITRRVVLENFNARNDAILQPGTWLVHDRSWKTTPLWCGPISTNQDGALMIWCFQVDGNVIRSALGDHRGRAIELPEGSYVRRRLVLD